MSSDPPQKKTLAEEIPDVLPLLPVRDLVVFPYMIAPLRVTRPISLEAVQNALDTDDRLCFIVAQREASEEDPKPASLYKVGTVGVIMRMRKLSDGGLKILVQGLCRARIQRFIAEQPCYKVRLDVYEEAGPRRSVEAEALTRTVRSNVERVAELGRTLQPELAMVLQNVEDAGRMADLVASNLTLKLPEAQGLLEQEDPVERLSKVNQGLENEIGILELQNRIQSRAKEEMSKTQRDYFLREQLRQIRSELGDDHRDELEELRGKVQGAALPEEARGEADKQMRRLEMMSPESAEAAVVRSYLDVMVELPWKDPPEEAVDLVTARRVLDEDHYDLEHIKERILDFLAVHKLRRGAHGPILCFLGPPGVGKTSLGRSIARALKRKFVRISLGGVRDEAEIRGHRRTYVGAMPGRILQGMKQAGAKNPVVLLDEVDKMGADFRGDPSAALLEVLDPEQNHTFRDHYLGVPYDLSKVMFIATANLIDGIPGPLRDRMEMLRLAGYSEEEKLAIAERYLLPKQIAEAGLSPKDLVVGRPVVKKIVSEYTREAGLRELERMVAQLARKVARQIVEKGGDKDLGKDRPRRRGPGLTLTAADLPKFLGPPRFIADEKRGADEVGIANGLAWTPYGGEVLHVEAQIMAGKGQLLLTGQLGDVMKESAQAALSFARAQALSLGLRTDFYADREIHIHVPAGGVPKDGPSAGVTMACVLVSLVSGIPVRRDVCMTGELTLRGRVLPVGGLKEKLLAAAGAGMRLAIIPAGNVAELSEVPDHVRSRLKIEPVRTMEEVLPLALARPLPRPATSKAGNGTKTKVAAAPPPGRGTA